jgi:hypothetical protein
VFFIFTIGPHTELRYANIFFSRGFIISSEVHTGHRGLSMYFPIPLRLSTAKTNTLY